MDIYSQLKRDEGEILRVYLDSRGIPTAGVGHNLSAHGLNWPVGTPITQEQSDSWLKEDLQTSIDNMDTHLSWLTELNFQMRYWAVANMCFNLGIVGLLGFHRTLTAIEDRDWNNASTAMLSSRWATQVGARATRLATQMRTGVWQ